MRAGIRSIHWSMLHEVDQNLYRFSFDQAFTGQQLIYVYEPEISVCVFCPVLDRAKNLILELKFRDQLMLGLSGEVLLSDQYFAEERWPNELDPNGTFSFMAPLFMAAERLTSQIFGLNSMELAYNLTRSCYCEKDRIIFIVFANLVKRWQPESLRPELVQAVEWRHIEALRDKSDAYDSISRCLIRSISSQ